MTSTPRYGILVLGRPPAKLAAAIPSVRDITHLKPSNTPAPDALLQSLPQEGPTQALSETIPVYSSLDHRLLGWAPPEKAAALMASGRGELVRDRRGRARRLRLTVQPGDEHDPRIWDLLNRMCESRKEVYRQVIIPETHTWIWQHKRTGKALEAYREIGVEELRRGGIIR